MVIGSAGSIHRGMNFHVLAIALLALAPAALQAAGGPPPREAAYFHSGVLDFNSRVILQKKIECVFYNHRLWPTDNPVAKPTCDVAIPDNDPSLQDAVQSTLDKSNALPS